jgi:hypothetical protein
MPPRCFWAAFQEALWPEDLQVVKHWFFLEPPLSTGTTAALQAHPFMPASA